MNKLPLEKRVQILSMLVEGSSMRSASRIAGVSINTVTKLLEDAGAACEEFHHRMVMGLKTKNLQCDEIWSFCYAKKRTVREMPEGKYIPGAGDVWTFTALDRDSKLMVSWFVGDRDTGTARAFVEDAAYRIASPVQVTTDGWPGYPEMMARYFGADASYGQLVKHYSTTPDQGPAKKYSPGVCTGAKREAVFGNPDEAMISTSHVERMNLNMRMGMRRFTRLTNAFSKKIDNHCHALALYFAYYNFCKVHGSLKITPAQAAGITNQKLDMADIVALIDAREGSPKKRGPYKLREGVRAAN